MFRKNLPTPFGIFLESNAKPARGCWHKLLKRVSFGLQALFSLPSSLFLQETLILVNGSAVKRPLSAKKVALCMNRLGFEQRRTKYSRGWNVIILTGNDIKEEQRLNAHRSAAE